MKITGYIVLILCVIILSCKDSGPESCGQLNFHLLNLDVEDVAKELDNWLEHERPEPTPDDEIGHKANLVAFIERLNDECDLMASINCYACIKTFPAQSEILVKVVYGGETFNRIIDIRTPESNKMSITNVHE